MKGKQLAILLALVVALGGLGLMLVSGNMHSWSQTSKGAGGKVLEFPVNDVAHIVIKTSSAELNLVKTDNNWVVQERGNYPANYEKIGDLLRNVYELKTVQQVKVGPSQMPRLELIEPGKGDKAGTLLDFQDKSGKRIAGLLVGKKYLKKSDSQMGDS